MAKRTTGTRSAAPWWLGGEEECPHCHHFYAYQLEVRCSECDGPSCPHCVSRHVELGLVCIDCSENARASMETANG